MMAADYRELCLFLMTGKYDKPGLSQGYLAYAWASTKMRPGRLSISSATV